jgi:hypothetical protein
MVNVRIVLVRYKCPLVLSTSLALTNGPRSCEGVADCYTSLLTMYFSQTARSNTSRDGRPQIYQNRSLELLTIKSTSQNAFIRRWRNPSTKSGQADINDNSLSRQNIEFGIHYVFLPSIGCLRNNEGSGYPIRFLSAKDGERGVCVHASSLEEIALGCWMSTAEPGLAEDVGSNTNTKNVPEEAAIETIQMFFRKYHKVLLRVKIFPFVLHASPGPSPPGLGPHDISQ